ncbi:MAG: SARP family transcriptional regulator, partial [Candidatus Competibacteraceae bacterium]|nr:SARP family transcriptional regulator [Candidatus Competibacteraceae bacterium]
AIARYRGEFLAGFQINDAAAFDDWRLLLQEHLHQQLMLALKTLQQHYAEQGRWPELAAAARRQLAIIPWLESAQRYLIQALAAQGQRQAALAQYRECCRILQDELGADPEPATRELADRLSKPCPVLAPSRHNLVQQLTSFIGREAEITQLHALIQRERLVTLFGLGGVGKSRLAHAVARTALNDFADGVWFVALANIEPGAAGPDQIALAIAGAIGFQITNVATPGIELAAYLADKHLLLVLDNWEHLIASAEVSLYPLLQTRAVHILATSRLRL